MSAPAGKASPTPAAAQPTDTYFDEFHKLPEYFNGEAVIVYHAPARQHRRRQPRLLPSLGSDQRRQPLLDGQLSGDRGGQGRHIDGVIDGLNKILDLAVAEYRAQGGTWIIPGRGRLSDTADVASYRNMVTIIRDRVKDLKRKGMTLAQVKAARPTMDFDGRYGSTTGPWTTDMFVEAVYQEPSGEEVMRRVLLLRRCRRGS